LQLDPSNDTLILAKNGSLYDRSLVNPQYNNLAPRLGLAFQVAPKDCGAAGYANKLYSIFFAMAAKGCTYNVHDVWTPQSISDPPIGPGAAASHHTTLSGTTKTRLHVFVYNAARLYAKLCLICKPSQR